MSPMPRSATSRQKKVSRPRELVTEAEAVASARLTVTPHFVTSQRCRRLAAMSAWLSSRKRRATSKSSLFIRPFPDREKPFHCHAFAVNLWLDGQRRRLVPWAGRTNMRRFAGSLSRVLALSAGLAAFAGGPADAVDLLFLPKVDGEFAAGRIDQAFKLLEDAVRDPGTSPQERIDLLVELASRRL